MVVGSPIVLNLIPGGVMPVMMINETDKGYKKEFLIYNGAAPYNLPANVSATIRGTKRDGYGVTEAAEVTAGSNLVRITVTEQMTAVPGPNIFELVFEDTNNLKVATINFIMMVERAALNSNTVISDSDIAYAEQVLNQLQGVAAFKEQLDNASADITELENVKIQRFDTVAQMKADTNLKPGMYARTGGYYAVNDGGGALYRIYSTAPSTYYETLANGLYALLITHGVATPQMFGAYADGTHDDAVAFETAIASGPVYVPSGTYYISRALNNPSSVVIFGDGRTSELSLDGSFLQNEIISSSLKYLYLKCNSVNDITVFPANITSSRITGCLFQYFKRIFYRVRTLSKIDRCTFMGIQEYFCLSIIDSAITNCYINAPKVINPVTVCFSGTISHSVISHNFIDYMYAVFNPPRVNDMSYVVCTNNVFDLCFTIFYKGANGVTFTGNTISGLSKSSNWDVSGNTEMNTEPWCIIRRTDALTNSYFGGNSFPPYAQYDMYLVCATAKYPTYDLIIDDSVPPDKIQYKAYKSQVSRDFQNIRITPMLKRTVSELPTATLTGSRETYNFDEVVYNDELYVNVNGVWKQITNAS